MNKRIWFFLVVTWLLLLVSACRWQEVSDGDNIVDPVLAQNGSGHPLVGSSVPDTTVYTLDDEAVQLDTIAAGEVRLINFWATWCPPCKREMPEFQALYEDGVVEIIGIDVEEGAAVVESFLSSFDPQITYPIYISKDASVERRYRLLGLPTTWLVDKNGTIRAVWTGAITREQVEQALSGLGK